MFHLSIQCVCVRDFINMAFGINDNTRLSTRSNRILKQSIRLLLSLVHVVWDIGLNAKDITLENRRLPANDSIRDRAWSIVHVDILAKSHCPNQSI